MSKATITDAAEVSPRTQRCLRRTWALCRLRTGTQLCVMCCQAPTLGMEIVFSNQGVVY
jgi:hypothetical protein